MKLSRGRRGIVRVAGGALGLAVLGLAGCAGEGGLPRTAVQVSSINDNMPLQSDVINMGTEMTGPFIPTDIVTVRFVGSATDPTSTTEPGDAFSTITINRYSIDFAGNDLNGDGVEDLHDMVNLPMNTVVPVGGYASAAVLIVPPAWKSDPSGALYQILGTGNQYTTSATITFYGEEATSHDVVTAQTSMMIMFADFVDQK